MDSWRGPLAEWSFRVRLIAEARAAPSVGVVLYNSRALPVLAYVAQLLPAPPDLLTLEMHAARCVWHVPGAVLSAAMAASLKQVGLPLFRSASALCAGALAPTALGGKVVWEPLWEDLVRVAEANLPMIRIMTNHPWPSHWQSPAFATT